MNIPNLSKKSNNEYHKSYGKLFRAIPYLDHLDIYDSAVLNTLILNMDETLSRQHNVKWIARRAKMSERKTTSVLSSLAKRGYIVITSNMINNSHQPNTYQITEKIFNEFKNDIDHRNDDIDMSIEGGSCGDPGVVHSVHQGGAQHAPGVVHSVHQGGARRAGQIGNKEVENKLIEREREDAASPLRSLSENPFNDIVEFDILKDKDDNLDDLKHDLQAIPDEDPSHGIGESNQTAQKANKRSSKANVVGSTHGDYFLKMFKSIWRMVHDCEYTSTRHKKDREMAAKIAEYIPNQVEQYKIIEAYYLVKNSFYRKKNHSLSWLYHDLHELRFAAKTNMPRQADYKHFLDNARVIEDGNAFTVEYDQLE